MSEKLNELKKATMASYLSKAGARVRSGTKIGLDFEHDAYKDMAVANKHHPNMVTPGFEKDPAKLASAEKRMKTNFDLANTFKRDAANRIKGIARAGRLLAKEDAEQIDELKKSTVASYLKKAINRHGETAGNIGAIAGAASIVAPGATLSKDELDDHLGKKAMRQMNTGAKGMSRALKQLAKEEVTEETLKEYKNTESHPSLWDSHELVHSSGKVLKKGDKVKTDRGTHKIVGFELPHHSGSTGRVYVHDKQAAFKMASYFPGVVDAKIRKKAVKEEVEQINELQKDVRQAMIAKYGDEGKVHFSKDGTRASHITRGLTDDGGDYYKIKTHAIKDGQLGPRIKKSHGKEYTAEEIEAINEVSRSTIAKVAQARYNQAQKALKDKNYHEYTVKMKKAIKASDATTPKTGWSHEEETQAPTGEPIVEVSAQEKYRQIRESKMRNRKGK